MSQRTIPYGYLPSLQFPFFGASATEASALTGFTGNRVDRRSEVRAPDCVEQALAHPRVRMLLIRDGRLVFDRRGEEFEAWRSPDSAVALGADLSQAILLGWQDAIPVLVARAGIASEDLGDAHKAIDLRSVYVRGMLNREDEGALAQGAALLAWHQNHGFCGRCGGRTVIAAGGYKRICGQCHAEHFPRTDPVAIMLAVRGEDCLLGRGRHFPPGMYSCLAGFIEPGESIENAVRRETLEESGLRIGRVIYHASQPWPFPYSLMIGCYAEALEDVVVFDERELEDCRWFSRDAVAKMLDATPGDPAVLATPPPGAIAHRLIADWVAAG